MCFLDHVGANRNLRLQLACCEIHENYVLVGPRRHLPDSLDVFWNYSSPRMCNCMWDLFYLDEFRHVEAILFFVAFLNMCAEGNARECGVPTQVLVRATVDHPRQHQDLTH